MQPIVLFVLASPFVALLILQLKTLAFVTAAGTPVHSESPGSVHVYSRTGWTFNTRRQKRVLLGALTSLVLGTTYIALKSDWFTAQLPF